MRIYFIPKSISFPNSRLTPGFGGDGAGFFIRTTDHAMNLRKVTCQHGDGNDG